MRHTMFIDTNINTVTIPYPQSRYCPARRTEGMKDENCRVTRSGLAMDFP